MSAHLAEARRLNSRSAMVKVRHLLPKLPTGTGLIEVWNTNREDQTYRTLKSQVIWSINLEDE